ncbi:MAG: chemotaxis protein CheD [Clostridiaceae bacterium]|nr:chemotaxis protein CheD [Clostridiaceae bacterium]
MEESVVGISDMKAAKGTHTLVTYALGSCVGVCLYDEVTGIGGMLHAMLPDSTQALEKEKEEKYVDTGVPALYRLVCGMGADKRRLKAKLVGGARMFPFTVVADKPDIGTANVLQAREALKRLGVSLVQEVTGGEVGRTIRFQPLNGSVWIHATDNTDAVI